jgi:hypothetical protein
VSLSSSFKGISTSQLSLCHLPSDCNHLAASVTEQDIARAAHLPEQDIAQLNLPIQKQDKKLETTGREYKLVAHVFAVEQHYSNMVKLPLLEL